ncbi:MAG TPA: radical SAM/SPASM domain-containing protein [bacterium]|nr:radical SAM/SPASM domain-containing protein [bacterium]
MNRLRKLQRLSQIFWHYKRRSTVLPYLPLRMWIETTNQCNLRCSVCPNATDTTSERGVMDLGLYESLLDQIEGHCNDINLSHRGEPLFHPELETMVAMAARRNLATRIHTNATILDGERAVRLLEAGPDLVSFSFDGYDKATYESVRVGGVFEETLGNIRRFLAEKRRMGKKKPYTVIQIIEPPGADAAYQSNLTVFGRKMRAEGLDKFYVKKPHNWAGNAPGESSPRKDYLICTFLYYSMTVLWNGYVCPCPQDWYGTMILGDLNVQRIWDVWNDAPIRELRRKAASCDLEGRLCDQCDRITRSAVMGVPTENIKAFFTETLAGYDHLRKLIRK